MQSICVRLGPLDTLLCQSAGFWKLTEDMGSLGNNWKCGSGGLQDSAAKLDSEEREASCCAVCSVSRDLLTEQMSMLPSEAGSVNSAESKSQV